MKNTTTLHTEAMQLAQQAFIASQNEQIQQAIQLYKLAYKLEKQVAMSMINEYTKEPTRAILFKSAALLAQKSHQYREAEKMACLGLSGEPSNDLAKELRQILESVYHFFFQQEMLVVE